MLRRFLAEHDVVNNVIFPAPNPPTYNETLPDLLWIGPERLQPVLFLPAPRARGLLLFLHGNAEDLGLLHAFVKSLQMALGVSCLAVEYPGYGLAPGRPSEGACNQAAQAALAFAEHELGFPRQRIFVFGRSIGSGPACALAAAASAAGQQPVGGLALQAPFLSIKAMARRLAGGWGRLVLNRFDNHSAIQQCSSAMPVVVVHGARDELIPPTHGETLCELAPTSMKRFFLVPDADHNFFKMRDVLNPLRHLLELADLKRQAPVELRLTPADLIAWRVRGGEQTAQDDGDDSLVGSLTCAPRGSKAAGSRVASIFGCLGTALASSFSASSALFERGGDDPASTPSAAPSSSSSSSSSFPFSSSAAAAASSSASTPSSTLSSSSAPTAAGPAAASGQSWFASLFSSASASSDGPTTSSSSSC